MGKKQLRCSGWCLQQPAVLLCHQLLQEMRWELQAGVEEMEVFDVCLFMYLVAAVSTRAPFCTGAISRAWLLLVHPCWLLFVAISSAGTKKPHFHPCWAALSALLQNAARVSWKQHTELPCTGREREARYGSPVHPPGTHRMSLE